MTFEEFLAARLPALLRYATAVVGDPHRAEDVVQDVLLRAGRKWRRIRGAAAPEAYLKKMIVNEHLSWRRRRASGEVPVETLDGYGAAQPDHAVQHSDRAEVWARLSALPPRQRVALALRYYDGLTDAEIAEIMGCAEATVRSHVSHALAALRAGQAAVDSEEVR